MVPDYCIADLSATGTTATVILPLALVILAIGVFVLWRRRSRGVALMGVLVVLALPLSMGGIPNAFAGSISKESACPANHHYDANKDKKRAVLTNRPAVQLGDEITFTALDFANGKSVEFTVHSQVVKAGSSVSKDGKATLTWKVPADFKLGEHKVVATVGERSVSGKFLVVPAIKREATDESAMKPKVDFIYKADGSSGKELDDSELINWDIAMKNIKSYYGEVTDLGYDGSYKPTGEKPQYVKNMEQLAKKWSAQLNAMCKKEKEAGNKPAAVFDTDDTTLWTYRFESDIEFAFSPDKAADWYYGKAPYAFNGGKPNYMPATPGMVDLIKSAQEAGCTIIGLTGRGNDLAQYSLDNLKVAGYVDGQGKPIFQNALYFTNSGKSDQGREDGNEAYKLGQDATNDKLKFCETGKKCSTVAFKAGTRQHIITDLGYKIVGNFGDQWSDLQGGRVEAANGGEPNWHKLPNPMYYLPDKTYDYKTDVYPKGHPLDGWQKADREAGMAPYVLHYNGIEPDGSAGKTATDGDKLPNMDIMKATIREYYNAKGDKKLNVPQGIANKQESPYIEQITKLTAKKADETAALCKKYAAEGYRPAAVFDTDDTTLSTYDEEDYGMNWHFTPQKQHDYFFAGGKFSTLPKYPAPYQTDMQVSEGGKKYNYLSTTPGMVELVKKVHDAGCTIIGLTGRNNLQNAYSVANLAYVGYKDKSGKPLFVKDLFFTKFTNKDGDTMPEYLQGICVKKANKCTTQEYKAGTRAHIERDLGYRIVGNFGDQWSDLQSPLQGPVKGDVHSDLSVKLPNITYYLPGR